MRMCPDDRSEEDADYARDQVAQTVTIILVNYNHGRFLDCSLGAIVSQTRPADEIIVIDDGSTDDSLQIIDRYDKQHPSIRVLANGKNRGVQYSIARAIGAATSDWLVWAAADDKLMPNFLERSMEMVERFPDVGVVFSRLATFLDGSEEERHYTGDNNPSSAFHIGKEATLFTPETLMERLLLSYLWLSGNTAVVRRTNLLDVGGFIPALEWHSDWFAFYAVALRYGACGIPETLAMMRVVRNTYSASGMADPRRQGKVMNAILNTLRRPDFADLRAKFRARPCLFSVFPEAMLRALARRPRDWDLLIRFAAWALNYRAQQYLYIRTGQNHSQLGTLRLNLQYYSFLLLFYALEVITPENWKKA